MQKAKLLLVIPAITVSLVIILILLVAFFVCEFLRWSAEITMEFMRDSIHLVAHITDAFLRWTGVHKLETKNPETN
jgi:hypothetical protein